MSSYLDAADAAVEHALALGARYADARVMHRRTESNGAVEALDQGETVGVGVRALVGSSWGFFAAPHLDAAALGARARAKALASQDPIEIEPGEYEVVLEPTAVSDVLWVLGGYGFNGKAMAPGRVLGIGTHAPVFASKYGVHSAMAPALRLAGWNFTGGASG